MRYKCSCCGNYTLKDENDDICKVCYWQEDIVQKAEPDYIGGPNKISLNQARNNYSKFGVCDKEFVTKIRKPFKYELPENN